MTGRLVYPIELLIDSAGCAAGLLEIGQRFPRKYQDRACLLARCLGIEDGIAPEDFLRLRKLLAIELEIEFHVVPSLWRRIVRYVKGQA